MLTTHFFKNTKKKFPKSKFRIRKWTKINVQNPFYKISLGILKKFASAYICRDAILTKLPKMALHGCR